MSSRRAEPCAGAREPYYRAHRNSVAPTVKPAPTDANKTRLPCLSLPSCRAVSMASGMVPAVVLP